MKQTKEARGVTLLLFANLAFTIMACLIRHAQVENAGVTALFRFTVGIVSLAILTFAGKVDLRFNNRGGLLWRGILGGFAIGLGFYGITTLGLVKASLLINTYPLFATLFGIIILKERPPKRVLLAISVAFIGILLVLSKGEKLLSLSFDFSIPTLLTIVGACIGGLAVVQVKELSKSESNSAIYMSQCLVGALLMLIPAGVTPISLSSEALVTLLFMGIFATIGQLCITEGIRHVRIATSSLLTMLGPVLTILSGMLFFQEELQGRTVVGILLTLSAIFVTVYKKTEEKAPQHNLAE